ncbi:FAD-dependent oxidoreductase [Edaphobacter aggregans]|uniref:FAD-dependent oxidoreductase n=1 Tax=Edaphobacter aggregans TaxID=570835 RepID=UPI00054E9802|nr:FAD-dependent oxidoreductase [Edaphobacter aggregans]
MNDLEKPDLKSGVSFASIPDGGKLLGVVDGEEVFLVRCGAQFFAVGAYCTHYHGPLADGLVVNDEVRCPWHHACFSLRTGEALRAPALDPIQCWHIEQVGDKVFVKEKVVTAAPRRVSTTVQPSSIIIIGGGAAGLAAADMLRRKGYSGPLTMISADNAPPCDRPNLSKDFLAGTAPEEWIPLRPPEWYSERNIDLVLNSRATSLHTKQKKITTEDGKTYEYGALLLATGADPVELALEGATPSEILYLRSFADSKAIVAKATSASQVVVVGCSFIGLEVAASLRARGIVVHVVAPDQVPMERIFGSRVGAFVRSLHESHGVVFHLGETVRHVDGDKVTMTGGQTIEADFIVLGVGVRPSISLAEQAGLKMDRGIAVDEYLETSAPGVFAAGDAARWPYPLTRERIRLEHWVVAERQGQTAARNMLGLHERFEAVPFFWSQHYDVAINYVGHAEKWDTINVDGDIEKRDCSISYERDGRTLAVVTIFRDLESLVAESELERLIRG